MGVTSDKYKHRLLSQNSETMRGECSSCGPVTLVGKLQKGTRVYRCSVAKKEQRGQPYYSYKMSDGTYVRISAAKRAELFEQFGHHCAICESTENLRLDHCHTTGKWRGILCNQCNTAIGLLGDSPNRLLKVLSYIS